MVATSYTINLTTHRRDNLIDKQTALANDMISQYDEWFADLLPEYVRSITRTAHIGLLERQ